MAVGLPPRYIHWNNDYEDDNDDSDYDTIQTTMITTTMSFKKYQL